jgi:hypothetical protein
LTDSGWRASKSRRKEEGERFESGKSLGCGSEGKEGRQGVMVEVLFVGGFEVRVCAQTGLEKMQFRDIF